MRWRQDRRGEIAPDGRRATVRTVSSPVVRSAPAVPDPATPKPSGVNSTRAAGVVGLAVMCSRVLGLARDQIFAALFGAGAGTDAFLTAFRAPNLLRDLFAEGALSTAFVTTFSKKIQLEDEQSAWTLANKVATLTMVGMSALTLLGIALSPQLIELLGGGFHAVPGKFELTVQLTRIMYPFILLVSLAALLMGMLNARHVFGAPAMASSFFNLGSIVGGVGLGYYFDPHFGTKSLFGLAIGTLIGGFLQLVVQFPALRRVGYRFRPDFAWRDPGVRAIGRLMVPAVIAASAVQINVMVNASFASHQGDGAVTWLNNAFRLMQLPLGVFGVAIATVTLPLVSRSAALGDTAGFRTTLAKALRLAFFLTVPSAIGLWCLGEPIIALLFQHGRFGAEATRQTAAALRFYALGLVAYSGIKVLAPAFYALDARKTPMTVSFIAIGINVGLNAFFTYHLGWGHRGLALSTSLTATINFVLLLWLMHRRAGGVEVAGLAWTLGRLAVAGSLLAGVCAGGQRWVLPGFGALTLAGQSLRLFGVIAAAGAVFFGASYLLRLEEMREVTALLARRLPGKRGRS